VEARPLAFGFALGAVGCTDEVPLGSWGMAGAGGTGGVVAGGGGGGIIGEGGAPTAECREGGVPGLRNSPGMALGTTNTNTDWFWPGPMDSIEWELLIEEDHVTDGYFWAHQFTFVQAFGGFFGVQMNGGYKALPPDGPFETSDMLLFWIGGPPLAAELGDIQAPDARTYLETDRMGLWWNIHARYDLKNCVSYRLRVGRESTELPSGNVWYGAWILDTESGEETVLGRILVPYVWGRFSALSTEWSSRIDYQTPISCDEAEPTSAVFGFPTANGGSMLPFSHVNRFDSPTRCATSRFTELPTGVRHELGI
jgi:hypothetical protein